MSAVLNGMTVGGSLIVAIGAQNAFVLSQGVKRNHILLIPVICIICDVLLIMLGVAGMGTLIASNESFKNYAAIGGALFLTWYGLGSLRSAYVGNDKGLEAVESEKGSSIVLVTLGLTLLNPHVYLDTVVLMGSIGGQYEGAGKYMFGLGASISSTIWFLALSFGGAMLAPFFKKKKSWQILDLLVAITMFLIAWMLVKDLL